MVDALDASARAAMTLPSVVSDLLMLEPSFSRVPVAPVELARSLPARSTRLIQYPNRLSWAEFYLGYIHKSWHEGPF